MEQIRATKRHQLCSIALLLLMMAWAIACAATPTPNRPQGEAATAQPQVEPSATSTGTTEPATAMPTVAPHGEGAGMTPTPAPEATEVEPSNEAESVVRLAQEDLARRLGLAIERIRLLSVEAVQWSDASLGCPQPGMMYAQVITPGFRVVLEAEGQAYEYHTDTAQSVILCAADGLPTDPVPLMPVAPHGTQPGKPRRRAD